MHTSILSIYFHLPITHRLGWQWEPSPWRTLHTSPLHNLSLMLGFLHRSLKRGDQAVCGWWVTVSLSEQNQPSGPGSDDLIWLPSLEKVGIHWHLPLNQGLTIVLIIEGHAVLATLEFPLLCIIAVLCGKVSCWLCQIKLCHKLSGIPQKSTPFFVLFFRIPSHHNTIRQTPVVGKKFCTLLSQGTV